MPDSQRNRIISANIGPRIWGKCDISNREKMDCSLNHITVVYSLYSQNKCDCSRVNEREKERIRKKCEGIF